MKFLLHTLTIALLAWVLQSFLPWWSMAIGAFAIGYFFAQSGIKSFFAGFFGVGLLWFGMAFFLDYNTQSVLTEKVAGLFPTKTVPLLFLATSLIGGMVGGLASLSGSLFTYRKKRKW